MRGDNILKIDTECHKGVLFVRLKGKLIKDTVDKLNEEVTMLIRDNGIKNVVFNINDLTVIDMKGINALLYNYELVRDNNGYSCICGIKNSLVRHRIKNSRLLKYMYESSDEIGALNIINLYKERGYDN
ncbi:MAG: STAS domain-containing protein [Mollicutes bacterium]|nr:STAS domain-containing protein [Mollicutes bacterium]